MTSRSSCKLTRTIALGTVAILASLAGACFTSACSPDTSDYVGCAGATPIRTRDGVPTGYMRCPDGAVDRAGPATCDDGVSPPCEGMANHLDCSDDSECASGESCVFEGSSPIALDSSCTCRPNRQESCVVDADCGGGEVCACGALFEAADGERENQCVPASCAASSDCTTAECGLSADCSNVTMQCRSSSDSCHGTTHCSGAPNDFCAYSPVESRYGCVDFDCVF